MAASDGVISRFRQPEYTGENRCMPCTVANTLMAAGASGATAVGGAVVAAPLVGAAAGGAVFVVSVLAIYLRGYLVPGTPELTKRYFPPWLLRLFGKEPVLERHQPVETEEGFDPETTLVRVGALEECADGDDLCLTDSFGDSWRTELDSLDTDTGRDELLELLDGWSTRSSAARSWRDSTGRPSASGSPRPRSWPTSPPPACSNGTPRAGRTSRWRPVVSC